MVAHSKFEDASLAKIRAQKAAAYKAARRVGHGGRSVIYSHEVRGAFSPPQGVTIGGTNQGDFHCWIVRTCDNKVVFDPVFDNYHMICGIRGCDITQPKYFEWGGPYRTEEETKSQNDFHEEYEVGQKISVIQRMPELAADWEPKSGFCLQNACFHWVKKCNENPEWGRKHRIVIGSFGWKKTQGGSVWWEFG